MRHSDQRNTMPVAPERDFQPPDGQPSANTSPPLATCSATIHRLRRKAISGDNGWEIWRHTSVPTRTSYGAADHHVRVALLWTREERLPP